MFNVELQLFYVVVSKQHVFIIFFWNVSKVASFFFIKKTFVSCLPYWGKNSEAAASRHGKAEKLIPCSFQELVLIQESQRKQ